LAPAADFGFLLWDGEILRVSAGIAQVGGDGRAGWEGIIGHVSFLMIHTISKTTK